LSRCKGKDKFTLKWVGGVAAAARVGFVMDMFGRSLRMYHQLLCRIGVEMHHAGLVVVDPDDRVEVLAHAALEAAVPYARAV